MSPQGTAMTFQVASPGKKPTSESHSFEETKDPSFAPGWHYTIENVTELYLKTDAAGMVYSTAEKDLDHDVLTRFSPGEPLIVPGLKPGGSRKTKHKVEVYDLSNLKKVAHSGSLDVSYTYIGTYRVTVPAGSYDAVLIKWSYSDHSKLGKLLERAQ